MKFISKIMKMIMFLLLMLLASMVYSSTTQAATLSSNIEGINEVKYPGYKEKIKQLQVLYPNIQVLYTGLDWNTVIKNERVHGRNLVPKSYSEEWRCEECGSKLYDTGWYCASEEAVRYLMDPRLYIDAQNIFQFQRLDTYAGTLNTSAIQMAALDSFLYDWENAVAIYEAAATNNINAFHLVTRTIQEQGRSGTSTLSSGNRYVGTNGQVYEGLYNLFSIGATGNNSAEVKTNGLARAAQEGWTSRPLSIIGGGHFIKDKYLNRKQNTLYLQKFDVDDTYDGVYWHQYMQNLFAAKNEAKLMYDAYNRTKLVLNRDFEFIIPIYENMPTTLSPEPTERNPIYRGDIANEIQQLELQTNDVTEEKYLKGEIIVTEWIDGVTWSVPRETPKIRLKEINGTQSYEMWVTKIEGNRYYFDGYISGIDPNKKYEIEVESGSIKNISPFRKAKGYYNVNKTLGQYKRHLIKIQNHIITFSPTNYYGDIATQIIETTLEKNQQGRPYLRGEILVTEWIGKLWNVPDVIPEITIIATDGKSKQQFWVKNIQDNRYYFDGYIDGLDVTKEYVVQVKLKNQYNISKYQTTNVIYPNNVELGKYNDYKIKIKDSKIIFDIEPYYGDIATEIQQLELLKNEKKETYFKGEIIVTEWLNGVTWSIPRKTPKIRIKPINGTQSYEMWVVKIEENRYYFDGYIEGIDTQKQYEIEVESGSDNNVSANRKGKGYYNQNKELGEYRNTKVKIANNKILFETDTYYGDIATEIQQLELLKNEKKETYFKGEIIVTEWLNGVTWSIPKETPKIRIKPINGSQSYEMWVVKIEGNRYYFDGYIEGIDTQKEYEIEVESGSKDNISVNRKGKGYYNQNKELGEYKDTKVMIQNNRILFHKITNKIMPVMEEQEEDEEIKSVLIEENIIEKQEDKEEEKTEQVEEETDKEMEEIEEEETDKEMEEIEGTILPIEKPADTNKEELTK